MYLGKECPSHHFGVDALNLQVDDAHRQRPDLLLHQHLQPHTQFNSAVEVRSSKVQSLCRAELGTLKPFGLLPVPTHSSYTFSFLQRPFRGDAPNSFSTGSLPLAFLVLSKAFLPVGICVGSVSHLMKLREVGKCEVDAHDVEAQVQTAAAVLLQHAGESAL